MIFNLYTRVTAGCNFKSLGASCILVITFFLLSLPVTGQISVSDNQTALALAQKLAGPGVSISSPLLHCAGRANGLFTVTNSNLRLDSGIVLTTGCAKTNGSLTGVNGFSTNLASNNNNYPGDASLDALAGQNTLDACILEFDMVPAGDTINIKYVFSSEEYINAVCGPYNDAFAFFISGPGITGADNMALVPGTNIPVTINSINSGVVGTVGSLPNCTSMGPGSPFTGFYVDNSFGTTVTHKGFTKVLWATHGVSPCNTYHLKVAIADAGNATYDSGVFLEAGSLSTESYNVTAVNNVSGDTSDAFCVKGCLPGRFRIKRTISASQAQTVKFTFAGTAIMGVDYASIPDSVVIPAFSSSADVVLTGLITPINGPKSVSIYILAPNACSGLSNIADSASLLIYDQPRVSVSPKSATVCGGDSISVSVVTDAVYSVSWSPSVDISNDTGKTPYLFPSQNTAYIATVSLPGSTCPPASDSLNVIVKLTPYFTLSAQKSVCYNSFLQLSPTLQSLNSFDSYTWSGPHSFTSSALSPGINNASASDSGLYALTITNDTNGCKVTRQVLVDVVVPPVPKVESPAIVCLHSAFVGYNISGSDLRWYDSKVGGTAGNIRVPGTDQLSDNIYYVSDLIGNCESPRAELEVKVVKCCDGNIFIPDAFTPNNDGLNDYFGPNPDNGYYLKNMWVYNRWGQLVYSGSEGKWDGTYGHQLADAGTYFYSISLGCINGGTTVVKGNVILVR